VAISVHDYFDTFTLDIDRSGHSSTFAFKGTDDHQPRVPEERLRGLVPIRYMTISVDTTLVHDFRQTWNLDHFGTWLLRYTKSRHRPRPIQRIARPSHSTEQTTNTRRTTTRSSTTSSTSSRVCSAWAKGTTSLRSSRRRRSDGASYSATSTGDKQSCRDSYGTGSLEHT